MPAGEDRIIYEEENTTVLADIEKYEARSRIADDHKYERLIRHLKTKGFNWIRHGKNKSLDGKVDSVEISLSYNYKLNRHRFEFIFPKQFKTMESHLFIHKFIRKECHDNPDEYEIGMVESSEFGIDEKNFPPGYGMAYILNLVKASKKSRSKFELYVHFRDEITKKLIKDYLREEGKTVRTETKGKYIKKESELIEKYLNEKNSMLDEELQEQIWKEGILSILESVNIKIENLGNYQDLYEELVFQQNQENQENIIIILRTLEVSLEIYKQSDQTLGRIGETFDKVSQTLERVGETLDKISQTLERIDQNQEKLSQNQELNQIDLINRIDYLSNQNIETQTIIKTNGFWFKIKNFFRKIKQFIKLKLNYDKERREY